MRISTRSRYGARLMISLAENYGKGNLLLKDIAKYEGISEKYLSQIVIPLRRAGLLAGSRGLHGGYTLTKPPSKVTAKEVIEILEGDIAVIECLKDPKLCERFNNCSSMELWNMLNQKITEFLSSITLDDLVKIKKDKELKFIDYSI